jgi:hypothetical protein
MGEDGKEYGPSTSAEIRQWVAEGRMDKKTPVKHAEKGDWIFLGEVPEFADLFKPKLPPPPPPPPRKGLVKAFIVLLVAVAAYYLIANLKHH